MLGKRPSPRRVTYVRELLLRFVNELKDLYGKTHMTYSVHNLVHVAGDYERFGVLDNVSAFPFESYMRKLKQYVHRPGQELQQAVKRKHEESLLDFCPKTPATQLSMLKEHRSGPLDKFAQCEVDMQYGEVVYRAVKYANTERDSYVSVDDRFGKIVNFVRVEAKLFTLVQFFTICRDFFEYPCKSRNVGIAKCRDFANDLEAVDLRNVQKCVAFPIIGTDWFYVAKLLHETLN
jgi:hypothetical protein